MKIADVIRFDDRSPVKGYRYTVYEHKLITEEDLVYSRSFIVLKNQYGVIVRFTRLHNFTGAYHEKTMKPLASDAKARMHYICRMLNYILIENHARYRIDHVFMVKKPMLVDFFTDYALSPKPDGTYRSTESVENCIHSVILFFSKLIRAYGDHVTLRRNELYKEVKKYDRRGRPVNKSVPDFEIRYVGENRGIFRDIPNKVFQILINLAIRYTPDIALAIGLQAFAGLRPGEVCNVRQPISSKGAGILLTYQDDRLIEAKIDLTREYPMRSDGVDCGKIKKERMQLVYTNYLKAFDQLYGWHMEFLAGQNFEEKFRPMFVNSRGMAMTYENYNARFQYLVDRRLRPVLLCHKDQECRIYGQMLSENRLGPHALRHWFSVQLTLAGETAERLQSWRGDSSRESAQLYLQNKGDLIRELKRTNDEFVEILLDKGAKYLGED